MPPLMRRYTKIENKAGRETIFIETIGFAKGAFQEDVRLWSNGLLNSHGGVVYFGVSSSGTVKGKLISRKEEDDLRLAVDHTFSHFQPFVSSQHYRLSFVPLEGGYKYIELKVSIGEMGEIYEDGKQHVYIIDAAKLIGPLHPQELIELILLKYKHSIEGAEEAAKYCTPNLYRAKTLAKTSKKPAVLSPIVEGNSPLPTPSSVTITRIQSSSASKKKPLSPLVNRAMMSAGGDTSIEITCVKSPQSLTVPRTGSSTTATSRTATSVGQKPLTTKSSTATTSVGQKPLTTKSSTATISVGQKPLTTKSSTTKITTTTKKTVKGSPVQTTTTAITATNKPVPTKTTKTSKIVQKLYSPKHHSSVRHRYSPPPHRATVQRTYSIDRQPPPMQMNRGYFPPPQTPMHEGGYNFRYHNGHNSNNWANNNQNNNNYRFGFGLF